MALSQLLLIAGLLVVLLASEGCASSAGEGGTARPRADDVYLAAYFVNNGAEGVFYASSDDGLRFEPFGAPGRAVITPEVGPDKLMRDPCLFRGPDGRWHMTWTTGWWDTGIGIAHSGDGVHWSQATYLPVMKDTPGTLNAWAPEITFDQASGLFILFWSSTVAGRFPETAQSGDPGPTPGTILNHRIYRTTTRDFARYSPVELMVDPGFNCIDATLLRRPGASPPWILVLKDETRHPPAKNLRLIPVDNPLQVKAMASAPITGKYWAEGPMVFEHAGRTRVLFDKYTENRFGGIESDDLRTWVDISDRVSFPAGARHGSVVRVSKQELDRIRAGLSSPSGS